MSQLGFNRKTDLKILPKNLVTRDNALESVKIYAQHSKNCTKPFDKNITIRIQRTSVVVLDGASQRKQFYEKGKKEKNVVINDFLNVKKLFFFFYCRSTVKKTCVKFTYSPSPLFFYPSRIIA